MIKQYPIVNFRLDNFLTEVEAISADLRGKITAIVHKNSVADIHLEGTLTLQDDTDLQSAIDNHKWQPDSPFRIKSLVNTEFKYLPVENIDFKRHLPADVALVKTVTMMPDGRPEKSEYTWNDTLYAEIRFAFQTANYLLTDRKEYLYYLREDGTYSDPILIKHKPYDLSKAKDGSDAIDERISARGQIVSSMKAVLSGIIMQAMNQNMDQVIVTISAFWDDSYTARKKFIEFGTDEWKQFIANIDLANTPYPYFAIPIDANGTTVKDYMLGRLTY